MKPQPKHETEDSSPTLTREDEINFNIDEVDYEIEQSIQHVDELKFKFKIQSKKNLIDEGIFEAMSHK